jgi:hypothetical protein
MSLPESKSVFFLGGHDLEMATIRDLLDRAAPGRVHDCGLAWGARASAYRDEIADALTRGDTPVLVELEDDLGLSTEERAGRVVVIDHHNDRAGADRPTSLEQVFAHLGLRQEEWTRHFALVSANDKGHIHALKAMGATTEEIVETRAADRAAQGVTPEQEAAVRDAIAHAERRCKGWLTIVRTPHDRSSPVTDLLDPALGGPGYEALLVLGPEQVQFFGPGRVIGRLRARFPGGYFGGELPERGFWGHPTAIDPETILEIVEEAINDRDLGQD